MNYGAFCTFSFLESWFCLCIDVIAQLINEQDNRFPKCALFDGCKHGQLNKKNSSSKMKFKNDNFFDINI